MKNEKQFFTETRRESTEMIRNGLTKFFSNTIKNAEERAREFARKKGSYIYSVFDLDNDFVGYGIPR